MELPAELVARACGRWTSRPAGRVRRAADRRGPRRRTSACRRRARERAAEPARPRRAAGRRHAGRRPGVHPEPRRVVRAARATPLPQRGGGLRGERLQALEVHRGVRPVVGDHVGQVAHEPVRVLGEVQRHPRAPGVQGRQPQAALEPRAGHGMPGEAVVAVVVPDDGGHLAGAAVRITQLEHVALVGALRDLGDADDERRPLLHVAQRLLERLQRHRDDCRRLLTRHWRPPVGKARTWPRRRHGRPRRRERPGGTRDRYRMRRSARGSHDSG